MKKKYALISVSDKSGILELAQTFNSCGIIILSTGGTAKLIRDKGIDVVDVSSYTGFPEMMDGRVKTLHPKVHGGILAIRNNKEHQISLQSHNIELIDFIVVNLYPFEKVSQKENTSLNTIIENIDIGGPTMIRSAAKNYTDVTVVTDPSDYPIVIDELKNKKKTKLSTREKLAVKAFTRTSLYDQCINEYLSKKLLKEEKKSFNFSRKLTLRYGENPHQIGAIYKDDHFSGEAVSHAEILHGKPMSYNNYLDAQSAYNTALEWKDNITSVIVKHGNPCGVSSGTTLSESMRFAWEGDVVSAFGSVIMVTDKVDLKTAEFLVNKFIEILIAPDFEVSALELLKKKSKNIRLLKVKLSKDSEKNHYRMIRGALLEQSFDNSLLEVFETVTEQKVSDQKKGLFRFAYQSVKHIKSNAISISHEYQKGKYMLLGIGAGQPNRVDSIKKLAVLKAKENIERMYPNIAWKEKMSECVLASDAFFPFKDNIEYANEAGIKNIIQPGGSIRDDEVISTCNRNNIAMVFTKMRHFFH